MIILTKRLNYRKKRLKLITDIKVTYSKTEIHDHQSAFSQAETQVYNWWQQQANNRTCIFVMIHKLKYPVKSNKL